MKFFGLIKFKLLFKAIPFKICSCIGPKKEEIKKKENNKKVKIEIVLSKAATREHLICLTIT